MLQSTTGRYLGKNGILMSFRRPLPAWKRTEVNGMYGLVGGCVHFQLLCNHNVVMACLTFAALAVALA